MKQDDIAISRLLSKCLLRNNPVSDGRDGSCISYFALDVRMQLYETGARLWEAGKQSALVEAGQVGLLHMHCALFLL